MAIVAFAAGAVVSLGTSWLLVTRLERLGARLGFSEALLGLLAALAADAPEITSSVTALVHHQRAVGSGVVIGSNVFNLAALLGLGAVVAGRIGLHRRVVALGGAVALWTALVCVASVTGRLPVGLGLALVLVVLVPYVALLATGHAPVVALRLPPRWSAWLASAVVEEEGELDVAIRPRRGTGSDAAVTMVSLGMIVGASVVMERAASTVGQEHRIAGIVVGGLVLAAVTSLPNAVAGVYLAARGRGAAMLEHHPEQQHPQRRGRTPHPRHRHRSGPVLGYRVTQRGLVRHPHPGDSGRRLSQPGSGPMAGLGHRRRLPRLRGDPPGRLLSKTDRWHRHRGGGYSDRRRRQIVARCRSGEVRSKSGAGPQP